MSLKIAPRTDVCSFNVAVFFSKTLSEQKGYRTIETALGVGEGGRERSCTSEARFTVLSTALILFFFQFHLFPRNFSRSSTFKNQAIVSSSNILDLLIKIK